MALEDTPRLGCGRSIDQLWATMDRSPTDHEQHCEPCTTAKDRLRYLSEAMQALRENDLNNPVMKPRPGLTNTIMAVARAEIRRSKRILLQNTPIGVIDISEQALSALIRQAAATVPGIHSRRCRIEIRTNTGAADDTAPPDNHAGPETSTGPRFLITLGVAAAAGTDIPQTTDALRRRLSGAIPSGVGVDAGTINITVEDLYNV